MMQIRKWLLFILVLVLCLSAFSCAEEASPDGTFALVPEDDQRMSYRGVSFSDAWPESIAAGMADCFPGERVIAGLYYVWQPLAGDPLPVVFAACVSEGGEKLVGAWHDRDKWNAQIISDRFFRPGQEFGIVMKPDHNMEGRVKVYQPAVRYDGEWFVFQPGSLGFVFDYYERERDWAEDCPDGAHMVIEIVSGRDAKGREEISLIVYSKSAGQCKTELFRGRCGPSFGTEAIDAAAFPTTLEEAYAYCEPNG